MFYMLGVWRLFIAIAAVVLLDAAFGVSSRAALKIGRSKHQDLILLLFVVVAAVAALYWLHTHVSAGWEGFVYYQDWSDVHAQLIRSKQAALQAERIAFIKTIFAFLEVFSAVVCLVMAKMQKRPLQLWLPIAVLGNVGAVVWLMVNRKRE